MYIHSSNYNVNATTYLGSSKVFLNHQSSHYSLNNFRLGAPKIGQESFEDKTVF